MGTSLYNNCTQEVRAMTITMPIGQARSKLTSLPRELHNKDTLTITSRGKPVLAVIPWDLFDSMMETLDIMGDEKLMKMIRQGIKEMKEGKGIPWEEAERRLGK